MPLSRMEALERLAGRVAHHVNNMASSETAAKTAEEILPAAKCVADLTTELLGSGASEPSRLDLGMPAVEASNPAPEPRKGAVLLVEHEPEDRRPLRDILVGLGYQVLEADTGQQAIHICQQYPGLIPLLLTDVLVPDMSGRELAERLALLQPHMAVVYLSAYTEDEMVSCRMLGGGGATLHQPITPEALACKLAEVFETQYS